MRQYLPHRCRLSVGIECLHFQGIHYGEKHSQLREVDDKLLQDLGGNAFEVRSSASVFVATIAVLGFAHCSPQCQSPLAPSFTANDGEDGLVRQLWGV